MGPLLPTISTLRTRLSARASKAGWVMSVFCRGTHEILLVKVQQSWSYLDCTVQTVSGIETMPCEAALPIFMLQLCLRTVQTKWPHDCVALTFNRSMGESNIRAMSRATLPWPRMTAVSHPRSGLSWKVMRMKHDEIRLERSRVVFHFYQSWMSPLLWRFFHTPTFFRHFWRFC